MIAAAADNGLHETWTVERCKPSGKGEKVRLRNSVTGELSGWASAVVQSEDLPFTIYKINVGGGSAFPDPIQDDETTREEHDEVAEVINMPSPAQDELDMQHLINEEEFSKMTVPELRDMMKEVSPLESTSKMRKADLIARLQMIGVPPRG